MTSWDKMNFLCHQSLMVNAQMMRNLRELVVRSQEWVWDQPIDRGLYKLVLNSFRYLEVSQRYTLPLHTSLNVSYKTAEHIRVGGVKQWL